MSEAFPVNSPEAVERSIDTLVSSLSIEEKASLTAGSGPWRTTAVPRLDIMAIKVVDGSTGARGDSFHGPVSACFPTGSALGATWDLDLLTRIGAALAEEGRLKGAHGVLGPTINLHRYPLGGRNFESFGEDPWHVSRLAVSYIRGLQAGGVAAAPKHLVGNDCEVERESIDVQVDEATLREVYLRPFEAAVLEAGAWMLMTSYNKINGVHASEHTWLLRDTVRQDWDFDGVLVSDWGGTHSTVDAAMAGLDLEMPGPPTHFGPRLAAAVHSGEVAPQVLDDKVRHILRLAHRTGAMTTDEAAELPTPTGARNGLAREAASSAAVLLKNTDGALPLDASRIRSLAVIGPCARTTHIQGGGSAKVNAPYAVSVLDGLHDALGEDVRVEHAQGCSIDRFTPTITSENARTPDGDTGILVELLRNDTDQEQLVRSEVVDEVDLTWIGAPLDGVAMADTTIRCRFSYRPEQSGDHVFGLVSAGRAVAEIDGRPLLDSADTTGHGPHFFGRGSDELRATVNLDGDRWHDIVITVRTRTEKSATAGVVLGVIPPQTVDQIGDAVALAGRADAAVVVVGTGPEWEMEGGDRPALELPGEQPELITRVAAANPRTVVVVNAGSAVDLAWEDDVPAVLYGWFGGQEVGNAVADVLLGRSDPGGRLPFSIPAHPGDMLDIGYRGDGGPGWGGTGGTMSYREGDAIGHRHHARSGRRARHGFGHGESYTTFSHDDFHVAEEDGQLLARCTVRNVGDREGTTVPQVYVTAPGPHRTRRLVGFTKATLAAGEETVVTMALDPRTVEAWSVEEANWAPIPGTHLLELTLSAAAPALGRIDYTVRARD